MAYYHTEDLNEPIPPVQAMLNPPADMSKEDQAEFRKEQARLHKLHDDEHKVRVKKQEARGSEASRFLYVVVHTASNTIVCSCEGKTQADYISGLLNDRPPR